MIIQSDIFVKKNGEQRQNSEIVHTLEHIGNIDSPNRSGSVGKINKRLDDLLQGIRNFSGFLFSSDFSTSILIKVIMPPDYISFENPLLTKVQNIFTHAGSELHFPAMCDIYISRNIYDIAVSESLYFEKIFFQY
jgi:hypothetical protein